MKSQKNLINHKRTCLIKAILRKKYTTGGFPDFKPYDNTIMIQTVWYWLKNKQTNKKKQKNKTDKWYKKRMNKCIPINIIRS